MPNACIPLIVVLAQAKWYKIQNTDIKDDASRLLVCLSRGNVTHVPAGTAYKVGLFVLGKDVVHTSLADKTSQC